MAATLPLTGDGDITQNSTTPADGKYKLKDIAVGGAAAGKTLTIEGSNAAASGDHNGGDIVLTPGQHAGSGTAGRVKVLSGSNSISFDVINVYPRITFAGESSVINWPSDKNLYFGETTYTGYFVIRGCNLGVGVTGPGDKVEVAGNVKAQGLKISQSTAPSNTVAGMLWYDSTNNILKIRNNANSGWNNLYTNS